MTYDSEICMELKSLRCVYDPEDDGSLSTNEITRILEEFKAKYESIKIKTSGSYAIFNYSIGADFTDPIVCEARGIIIDMTHLDVVCWPFRKFGRYDEPYADTIDWSSAKVQEKIDGSIIKVWHNFDTRKWQFSSNSMIDANDAIMNDSGLSLMDIIKQAKEYDALMEWLSGDDSDRYLTYILELVSPDNRVVVPYEEIRLFQTGCRMNLTGEEKTPEIPVLEKPKQYALKSLQECIQSLTSTNSTKRITKVENEGYVVVDKDYHRIKIKSPEYMIMHHLVSITKESKTMLVDLIYNGRIDVDSMSKYYPNLAHILKYYDFRVAEILHNMKSMADISRRLYELLGRDRKALAMRIKKDEYSSIGFYAVNNPNMTIDEIIDYFGVKFIQKRIDNYPTGRFTYLFDNINDYEAKEETYV